MCVCVHACCVYLAHFTQHCLPGSHVCWSLPRHTPFRRSWVYHFCLPSHPLMAIGYYKQCCCCCCCVASVVYDSVRPHRQQPNQASPSLGFSRQEHWSGSPFPSPTNSANVDLCVELLRGRVFIPFGVLLRAGLPGPREPCAALSWPATLRAAARVESWQPHVLAGGCYYLTF